MKHYMLGVVEFHRGRTAEARDALNAALAADAEFPRAEQVRTLLARLEK